MNSNKPRLHTCTCSFSSDLCGVKGHLSWNGLVGEIVFISLVLDKNWNLKSVTRCQRCHKQVSAGCLDVCNEISRIFAQPIKTSRVSNWSGKLASSSMLFNVGLDLSVKNSSSSLHISTQSRLKMGARWCGCDEPWSHTEIYFTQTSQPHQMFRCFVGLFLFDLALWGFCLLRTRSDHSQDLCFDNCWLFYWNEPF